MIYRAIGKAVITMGVRYARLRYARQIKVAIGLGVVGIGIAAYLAARDVPEG